MTDKNLGRNKVNPKIPLIFWIDCNCRIFCTFIDFINVIYFYDTLGFSLPFERIIENPLAWMDEWLDINMTQNANQEAQATNYQLNSIIDDAGTSYIEI